MPKEKNPRMDGFIKNVRPDPSSSEEIQLLIGYIGESPVDGHFRIYFDEHLNNFVEVPLDAILETKPFEKSENPLGGSRVWVKKSTVVTFGDPSLANRPKSSFLRGDLITAFGNMGFAFGGGGFGGPGGGNNTFDPGCRSVGDTACITNNPPCPTADFTCHSCGFTCFRTCDGPTCNYTCGHTCPETCGVVICFNIRSNPPDTACTCVFVEQIGPATRACGDTGVINQGAFGGQRAARYSGAFNPYRTGHYGY